MCACDSWKIIITCENYKNLNLYTTTGFVYGTSKEPELQINTGKLGAFNPILVNYKFYIFES